MSVTSQCASEEETWCCDSLGAVVLLLPPNSPRVMLPSVGPSHLESQSPEKAVSGSIPFLVLSPANPNPSP